jgi:hypothetical protein
MAIIVLAGLFLPLAGVICVPAMAQLQTDLTSPEWQEYMSLPACLILQAITAFLFGEPADAVGSRRQCDGMASNTTTTENLGSALVLGRRTQPLGLRKLEMNDFLAGCMWRRRPGTCRVPPA